MLFFFSLGQTLGLKQQSVNLLASSSGCVPAHGFSVVTQTTCAQKCEGGNKKTNGFLQAWGQGCFFCDG